MPDISAEWRRSLKVGDRIDVLKEEKFHGESIKGWAVATIRDITNDILQCTYDGMNQEEFDYFAIEGPKISPVGLRTEDWEWRGKILEGDNVDICDTQAKWYLGTVLKVANEHNVSMLFVGFRVYFSAGTKRDSENRPYEGWSYQYDAWIPAYSVRVQRYSLVGGRRNLVAKLGTIYCRRALDDESPAPDDSCDVLQNCLIKGARVCAVHRPGNSFASVHLEMLNDFEARGGLEMVMEVGRTTKSFEVMHECIGIVAAPYKLYHRVYVIEKLTKFVAVAVSYMANVPKEEFRSIKKGALEEGLGWTEDLMRRVYTSKTKGELVIKLRMDVSINLLGTELLEKRIQAVRLIADTCKAAKASQECFVQDTLPTANDSAVLSSLLQVPQLIEEIFGKRSHIELIQRSTEILKFVLLYSKITQEEFNVIWDCCTRDEQSKVEIFKVISDSCHLLPKELLGFIIDKLVALGRDEFKAQDVKILLELLLNCTKLTLPMLKQVLELMWLIVKGDITNLPADIAEKVMTKFCDAITTASKVPVEIMHGYFGECYRMLEQRKQPLFALRVLRRSMAQLPNVTQLASRNEMLFSFLTEGKVFANFFRDFEEYCEGARKNKQLNEQAHREELLERKGFVVFLVKYANYKLTKEDFTFLWENLVHRYVLLEDQNSFYQIMWELFFSEIEKCITSFDDLTKFFESTICSEENNYQQLSVEGMRVINALILFVNKYKEKIVEVSNSRKKRYESKFDYTNMIGTLTQGYSTEDFKGDIMDFRVRTLPAQIIGCSLLWKIILEATSESVTMMAIDMINKIYTKLSEDLDNRIGEISSGFVETAIEKLRLCHKQVAEGNQRRSNEIVKLLRLVEGMLDNSERKGNSGVTPFAGIQKGFGLTVKVQTLNMNSVVSANTPDEFDLPVHSSITYCQLTMLIAKRLNLAYEILRLIFMTCEVKDSDNGRTLEELKVPEGEVIKVTRRTEEFIPRVSLVKDKALTDKARSVFTELFDRFSKHAKMLPANYAEFAQGCLGDATISENDYQIIGIYKDYDKEKKGYLALSDFLNFYETASIGREEVVWNNLKELGYGPDLNKLDAERPIVITNTLPRDKLPRYLLANDSDYLDFLFSLVSKIYP